MSREDAENILDAMQQQEDRTREKVKCPACGRCGPVGERTGSRVLPLLRTIELIA